MVRTIKVLFVLALLLGAAGVGTWYYIGRQGSSDVEQWIGRFLVGVIEQQINPRVRFEQLDYQAPYTVVIDKLALTSGEREIIAIDRAVLELAEIPASGQPVRIKQIDLTNPRVLLVQKPGEGLAGWSQFAKPRADRQAAPEGQKLSDVLRLRHVAIRNGQIVYDAGDGSPVMTLPDINMNLETPPVESAPGAYKLVGRLERKPVLALDVDGQIDLDTSVLTLASLKLGCVLGEEQYGTLPPAVQQMLREHQARGKLEAVISGEIPLTNPQGARTDLRVTIADGKWKHTERDWTIDSLVIAGRTADGKGNANLTATLLGGQAEATLTLGPPALTPFDLTWNVRGVRIEQVLTVLEEGKPKYAGTLQSEGRVTGSFDALPASLNGSSRVTLREGRVAHMPIVRHIHALAAKTRIGSQMAARDSADLSFAIKPDQVTLVDGKVVSTVLTLRGEGPIYYDGRLDLDVKAGLLENVNRALGEVGSLVSKVTEQAIRYQVHGTVSAPQVSVRPLGIKK